MRGDKGVLGRKLTFAVVAAEDEVLAAEIEGLPVDAVGIQDDGVARLSFGVIDHRLDRPGRIGRKAARFIGDRPGAGGPEELGQVQAALRHTAACQAVQAIDRETVGDDLSQFGRRPIGIHGQGQRTGAGDVGRRKGGAPDVGPIIIVEYAHALGCHGGRFHLGRGADDLEVVVVGGAAGRGEIHPEGVKVGIGGRLVEAVRRHDGDDVVVEKGRRVTNATKAEGDAISRGRHYQHARQLGCIYD